MNFIESDFYVYEWYNRKTNEVFYVGKGCKKRYCSLRSRNQLFLDYIKNNDCDVRIVKNGLTENEALSYELELSEQYKAIGQCQCCLAKGGTGGRSSIWTDEFRQYWSVCNPMKAEKQRKRMQQNNPEIAKKNGASKKRPVIIDGVYYCGVIDAANACGVRDITISAWCKRGYNTNGKPCRYADEEQKDFIIPKLGKGVLIDGKDYYPTVKAAALALGSKDSSPLCKALKSNKIYKGHKCEYADQQPSEKNS